MFADATMVLYLFLYNVPFAILRYYPFVDKLRISLSQFYCVYSSIFMIQIITFFMHKDYFYNMLLLQQFRLKFVVIYLLLSFIVIKENIGKHFFVYLMMLTYSALVNNTANRIEILTEPYFNMPAYFITNVAIIVQLMITYPLVYRFIKNKLMPLLGMKNTNVWNYIWIIPFVLVIFSIFFGTEISVETPNKNIMNWYYYLARCLVGISFFSIYFILIKVMEETNKNATLHEQIRMTDKLLAAQGNHYKTLTKNIENARMARHDLRHHILVLQSYLNDKQYDQIAEYLEKYDGHLVTREQPLMTQHYIVDAILQHYKIIANDSNIMFSVKVDMPSSISVDDFDICIILGNILENAIEACQRMTKGEQFIDLRIKKVGNMLILTLDNSHDGIVKSSSAATAFFSSKRSGNQEGIGLTSVQSIISKYNGVFELHYTNEVFKTSIMLNLPQEEQGLSL